MQLSGGRSALLFAQPEKVHKRQHNSSLKHQWPLVIQILSSKAESNRKGWGKLHNHVMTNKCSLIFFKVVNTTLLPFHFMFSLVAGGWICRCSEWTLQIMNYEVGFHNSGLSMYDRNHIEGTILSGMLYKYSCPWNYCTNTYQFWSNQLTTFMSTRNYLICS